MEKTLIKTWLLNKKPRVYTAIVQLYFEKLSNLRTSLFIEWLALELDVPIESINKSSLSSALRRYRKRITIHSNKVIRQPKTSGGTEKSPFDTELPERIKFT